jgi:Tfp pilus assembly protein PilP
MRSAITLGLGILVASATLGLRAQAKPSAPNSAKSALQDAGKPAQQTAKPAAPAATKPAPQAAKPAAPAQSKPATPAAKPAAQAVKPAGNPAAKTGAKPATKPAGKTKAAAKPATKKAVEKRSTPGSAPAAAESEIKQARRDPFESLVGRQNKGGTLNLPPGKLGLQVSTLRLDGIVRSPNGMIAVVSNPQSRTYFLREGDRLYDGSVEKISMDSVSFHEEGKDAFGKPVERQVNKRIYSSPGELQ